ncbi:protein hairy-like [Daphnia carinata]|uniref:protein hairy-like n=1 Tax=Daphnia carinata TaxID=120202 RepID=UPI002579C1FA|nr:protein hairy-like [Daphnia carinata]
MTAKSDKNLKSSRSDKRRTNKPLMEKRRRARINHSLSVLKSLIIKDDANSSNPTSQSRLEKADILELTVMHLRALEKQKEEHLQQQQQSELVEKESNSSVDSDVKSYRLGYQACCHDIGRFLDGPVLDLTKERLMEHLLEKKQKLFQLSNSGDPSDANLVTPTRLSDGRLALIFSSTCSWLSGGIDLPASSSASSSSFHSNLAPATPPSSPDQQVVVQPLPDSVGNVWRPWF